ncbi:MAG: hypothetical protein WC241_05060 [Candidatus Paceibacterota bacterium]|jgi:hypothetical protein
MTKIANSAAKPAKRKYSHRTLKILFGLSGNKCAHPNCSNPIIKPGTDQSDDLVIGQICHIYAVSEIGPRGKPGLTEAELNAPENLILCCPTHHVVVDGQHEDYPATLLTDWKKVRERSYRDALALQINAIGYAELEVAAKALMSPSIGSASPQFIIIPPGDKITKNGLSSSVELLLRMGAAKSHEVAEVLMKAAQLDSNFPDRLREGFVIHYAELRDDGCVGDELFYSMYHWVSAGSSDQSRVAAGLCILVHLFVICDVFEK